MAQGFLIIMNLIDFDTSDLCNYYKWAEGKFIDIIEKIPEDIFEKKGTEITTSIRNLSCHLAMI